MQITGSLKNHQHNLKDLSITSRNNENGFLHLPGGLLIQWGQGNTGNNNYTKINFPKPFKQVYQVVTQTLSNGDANFDMDVNWNNNQVWARYAYKLRYIAIGLA